MPKSKFFVVFFSLLIGFTFVITPTYADKLDDVNNKINKTNKKLADLTDQKNALTQKISQLTQNLSATSADIASLNADIADMEKKLADINVTLEEKRISLSSEMNLRDMAVSSYYRNNLLSNLEIFLMSLNSPESSASLTGFQKISQTYIAQKTLSLTIKSTIETLNRDIDAYEKQKREAEQIKSDLDTQKRKLVALKEQLAVQQASVQQDLNSKNEEIKKVNDSLAALTSLQQKLLAEKFGATSENTTVGDSEQSASTLPEPPFHPAFAFFTYGYPHRVGANQYGMYGRSKAGQSYKTILKAYFQNVDIEEDCDKSKTIPVIGYGNIKLEDTYLMGIGEMPESWGSHGGYEALKAQVVLARTYALNYVGYYWDSASGSIKKKSSQSAICTSQSCQVYTGGKKTGDWKRAVNDTCGVVLKYKGSPITAWYASTAGGYTRTSGQVWGSNRPWSKGIKDGKCSDLFDCSYDGPNYGKSPWFHKAWGTNKTSGSAWMNEEQAEDMFNSALLSAKNSDYNQYLSPTDKGGWSTSKVKSKLGDLGISPVGKINSIVMKDDGSGFTTSVVLSSENYPSKTFDGSQFKSIYNLRSPGTLVLWTSFYDVLKK